MWSESKTWFEDKVAELGGIHEDLVKYYADQIYITTTPSATRRTSEVASTPDSTLVFGFLPKKVANVLSERSGGAEKVLKALQKTLNIFKPDNIPRHHILPTLPLFVDTIMSHVTSTNKQTTVLSLTLLERIALFEPSVVEVSLDIMMPFFVSLLADEDQVRLQNY